MTLLFSRAPADEPSTHAFVIGVGGYPSAKEGAGCLDGLIAPDVPSAADSAKFFCDWLLENRDLLVAPLASLEVLISDTDEGEDRYPWKPPLPEGHTPMPTIDEATESAMVMLSFSIFAAMVPAYPANQRYSSETLISLQSSPGLS
jgi:hypothetical protein